MLPKIRRLFRRDFRALSRTPETVPLGNKENLPSGNKEHTPQSTPNVGQPPLSPHSIERWLENVTPPVYGPPINRVRPEVDNIDIHIDFSKSSESGPLQPSSTRLGTTIPRSDISCVRTKLPQHPLTSFSLYCYPGPVTIGSCSSSLQSSRKAGKLLTAEHHVRHSCSVQRAKSDCDHSPKTGFLPR